MKLLISKYYSVLTSLQTTWRRKHHQTKQHEIMPQDVMHWVQALLYWGFTLACDMIKFFKVNYSIRVQSWCVWRVSTCTDWSVSRVMYRGTKRVWERERERVFRVRNHWISVCAKMVYQCVICMSTQSVVTSPYKGLSACPHAHTLMYLYLFTRTNGLTNHRNWWLSDVIELMRKWPQRSLMSSTFITHPLSCFVPSSLIFHFSHSLASRPL